MAYIFLILLFSPILLIFFGGIFSASKNVVQNVGGELFKPEKGKYNTKKIDLLTYVFDNKTFMFYIQMQQDNYDSYIMLRHLTEDYNGISTYKSTYIIIPRPLAWKLSSEFGEKKCDNYKIKDKELLDVLKFLLKNFDIIRYNDYPNDINNHYSLVAKNNSYNNLIDDYLNKVFKTVKNFRDIYYDFNLTENYHTHTFLKLLNEHNWDYNKFEIPSNWKFDFGSKKYNIAIDSFYDLD